MLPRVSEPPRNDSADLLDQLRQIVGEAHLLTGDGATLPFRTGYRFGGGPVRAVVRPGSLVEQWQVLKACVATGAIVIMQAANTGLTGGSTPFGADYDRDRVIVNTMRMAGHHLLDGGAQIVCLPGTTLFALEKTLAPLGREPHSVIGSSCIGASVLGGICNNSGGALVQRGPAFTELALYARVDEGGALQLVNHLGIDLGKDPETMLDRLDRGDFTAADIIRDPARRASDRSYADHVRDIDAPTPARFNADPTRLFEASGSAGKVAIFAVRLDTFPQPAETAVFYIGTNDPAELTQLRRHVLSRFKTLPVAGEYIHRDAFDIAETHGKDTFLALHYLGTDRLPWLFACKAWFDGAARRLKFLPPHPADRLLQALSHLFPNHLPQRMRSYRRRFDHHLILKMAGPGIEEARDYLAAAFPSGQADFFECTPEEAAKAFLHRFAVAGAAVRYRAVHGGEVEDIVALDIALPRNAQDWFETLPAELDAALTHKLYYGHFFCHVFHQDYIVAKGHAPHEIEQRICALLDARGAEYPAEHNVGHLYPAKPALERHYRALDPCNAFNPGIGGTSRRAGWE